VTTEPTAAERWDERYAGPDYLFGTEPNDFLRSVADELPEGRALCLGEGEGRNAVFLAERGYEVTAVDASATGLRKATRLASERGVEIRAVASDLADYTIEPDTWDVIVLIFVHLPPPLRRAVHRAVVAGLRPGGVVLLEAHARGSDDEEASRGPPREMLMGESELRDEFEGLDLEIAREVRRDVEEGTQHQGGGSVVQLLGRRQAPTRGS
jgi:SAM-dependent methyltransferase